MIKQLICWFTHHNYKEPCDKVMDIYNKEFNRGNVVFIKCNRCKQWENQEWPLYFPGEIPKDIITPFERRGFGGRRLSWFTRLLFGEKYGRK